MYKANDVPVFSRLSFGSVGLFGVELSLDEWDVVLEVALFCVLALVVMLLPAVEGVDEIRSAGLEAGTCFS